MATFPLTNDGGGNDMSHMFSIMTCLERGLNLTRIWYSSKKPRSEWKLFQVKLESRQLIWQAGNRREGVGKF